MKAKSYKIMFSLQEGYDSDAKVHRLPEAERIIKAWLTGRLKQNQPIITGLLQEGTLFFPSKQTDQDPVTLSPTGIFTGELSEPKDMKRSNKEVKATLTALASELKQRLKQESVFIVYRDKNWCV